MSEVSEAPQRLSWTQTELYKTLWSTFPELRTKHQKVLDVGAIAAATGLSKEGLYKWLRAGRIKSAPGLQRIVQFANTPGNVAALERAGQTPPTEQDFARFLFT